MYLLCMHIHKHTAHTIHTMTVLYYTQYKQGGRDGKVTRGRADRGHPELPSFVHDAWEYGGSVWVYGKGIRLSSGV